MFPILMFKIKRTDYIKVLWLTGDAFGQTFFRFLVAIFTGMLDKSFIEIQEKNIFFENVPLVRYCA